jgi:hypothetical protein
MREMTYAEVRRRKIAAKKEEPALRIHFICKIDDFAVLILFYVRTRCFICSATMNHRQKQDMMTSPGAYIPVH